MIVRDIIEELKDAVGTCDQTQIFRTTTRGIELLANEGLFDPLISYLEFTTLADRFFIALPREVKTPLRVNINGNPTFFRNRFFEFTLNTNGSEEGEQVGWSWSDRGNSPIQDEKELPSKLKYNCADAADNGKTCTVFGKAADGRDFSVVLVADRDAPVLSMSPFSSVTKVIRQMTDSTCLLLAENDHAVGQYYPDETSPSYRVIKLSKAASSIRMKFRRHVFALTSLDDLIPINSSMAVIMAAKAVMLYSKNEFGTAEAALTKAVDFVRKEQASSDEANELAGAMETPNTIDTGIFSRETVIVSDIYDDASEIFGPLGRGHILDKITMTVEVLRNKAHWDSMLGIVDIWPLDRSTHITVRGTGHGYVVLPRFVETVLAVNISGWPGAPRNGWYEFHLNGFGEQSKANSRKWDYAGRVSIINELRYDTNKRVKSVKLLALAENPSDVGKTARIFGIERRSDGGEVEVIRGGERGYLLTFRSSVTTAVESDSPDFVRFDRISKEETAGFVHLRGKNSEDDLWLGIWQPDEVEPNYARIKTETSGTSRLRIWYRKRLNKITSLLEPIPLRSRIALVNMMRAIAAQKSDPQTAAIYEATAVRYLNEDCINDQPSAMPSLQFDDTVMPGHNCNIT